ncbi:MAG TPA: amidase [Phototrophicaceae bacterium]|nr:amidase [Phototrophicaceae bacterium]
MTPRRTLTRCVAATATAAACGLLATGAATAAVDPRPVDVLELGVAGALAALDSGETTSVALVEQYLARIAAYDGSAFMDGGLASIVSLNDDALDQARARDEERAAGSLRGPLHGVPVLIKDNIDTSELPTSHGNQALATYQPLDDAEVVARLRAAGAIILGKTNMAEFAAYWDTFSSVRGRTLNPYDTQRNINGSSGGSGAAVAASLGTVALGTESCGSITDVASFANLVGLRPTQGLVSKSGVDYNLVGDAVGPLALNVTDAALVLDVLAGTDPADPWTAGADAARPETYTAALSDTALDGLTVGYMVEPLGAYDFTLGEESESVLAVADAAAADLVAQGATVVPVAISDEWFATYMPAEARHWASGGRQDYFVRTAATWPEGLAARTAPVDQINYADLVAASDRMDPVTIASRLGADNVARDDESVRAAQAGRALFGEGVDALFEELDLDLLAYPTMAYPPVVLHDDPEPTLVDSEQFGSHCAWANYTGRPVITVPAGFDDDGLPVGLSLLGDRFGEVELLGAAYDYEQATGHRTTPALTPSILEQPEPEPEPEPEPTASPSPSPTTAPLPAAPTEGPTETVAQPAAPTRGSTGAGTVDGSLAQTGAASALVWLAAATALVATGAVLVLMRVRRLVRP